MIESALAAERISINDGWRFQRGDPQGYAAQLQYDVRPEVRQSADGKVADSLAALDKGALAEYAAKYEVKLDARKGEAKMRAEVANLIEQFGAR